MSISDEDINQEYSRERWVQEWALNTVIAARGFDKSAAGNKKSGLFSGEKRPLGLSTRLSCLTLTVHLSERMS